MAPEWLEQAQDDATILAIRDQERAGLDIITDGEMRRESYSNRFATALDGVDIDNPGTALDRSGHPNPVPRVVGPDPPPAPGAGARRGVPAPPHDQADQDHGARPLHHEPAGAGRLLQGRGGAGHGLRGRRQRRDRGPVRGRRRHRAGRRALHAGAAREGQALRRPGARPRARRHRRHHRDAHLLRLCRRHPQPPARAIPSCRSSRPPRCSRSPSRRRRPSSTARSWRSCRARPSCSACSTSPT